MKENDYITISPELYEKMFESMPIVSMKVFEGLKNIMNGYVENKRRDDQN